jgi:hypothetical protein
MTLDKSKLKMIQDFDDSGYAPTVHSHDDLYYTEAEVDAKDQVLQDQIDNIVVEDVEYAFGAVSKRHNLTNGFITVHLLLP